MEPEGLAMNCPNCAADRVLTGSIGHRTENRCLECGAVWTVPAKK